MIARVSRRFAYAAGKPGRLPTRIGGHLLVALTVMLLAAYLLVYGGRFHVVDEVSIYAMGENLAKRGALDTNQITWTQWVRSPKEVQGDFGPDGAVYSKKGFGTALAPAFLVRIGLLNPAWGLVSTALFTNAIVTALTAALLAAYAGRLGARRRTALILGAVFGLGTIALPYTRMLFGEPSSALALVAAAYCLTYVQGRSGAGWAVLAGLAAAFAVWTRLLTVLALVPFALYLLSKRASLKSLILFGAAAAVAGVGGYLAYNAYRFGSPFNSGYQFGEGESFVTPLLTGLYGLLLSPLRGIFWFSPVLLAAIPGAVLSWRRSRPDTLLAIGIFLAYLLPYSAWWMWWGGFAWGPRFLLPVVPFLLILTIPLWETPRAFWFVLALAIVSLVVQILAVAADFTLSETVLENTFGNPAQSAAMVDPRWSPIVLQARYLAQGFWDIAWQRVGRAALPALALAVTSGALALFVLIGRGSSVARRLALWTSLLLVTVAYVVGLDIVSRHVRETPHEQSIAQALAPVNAGYQPGETLVTLAPYDYTAAMNWLHAPAPVVGLAPHPAPLRQEEEQQLSAALAASDRVRLLAPRLLPGSDQAYVEQWLTGRAFIYDQQWHGDSRMVSYWVSDGDGRRLELDRAFAGQLQLTDVTLHDEDLRAGSPLLIETRWGTAAPPPADYTIFAHLLAPDGKMVAGFDGQPANGYAPTSTWRPGDVVGDRRALLVPEDAAPGSYTLELGLYDPASGQRLAVGAGSQTEDRVLIPGIQVR